MKRTYKSAQVIENPEGFALALDGMLLKSAKGRVMAFASKALAEALASEWEAQEGEIVPAKMPVNRVLSHFIDMDEDVRENTIHQLLEYATTDLVSVRNDYPEELKRLQDSQLEPIRLWFKEKTGVGLPVTYGIITEKVPQNEILQLSSVVECYDNFHISVLAALTAICHSLALAFSITEGRTDPDKALALIHLEENFQAGMWGEDLAAMSRIKQIGDQLEKIVQLLKFYKQQKESI